LFWLVLQALSDEFARGKNEDVGEFRERLEVSVSGNDVIRLKRHRGLDEFIVIAVFADIQAHRFCGLQATTSLHIVK
jgi:hypothetical protein